MLRIWVSLLVIAFVCQYVVECVLQTDIGQFTPKIETVDILVNGNIETVTVESFRGIPYAKPPVGKLRYVKSVLFEGNASSTYGSEFGSICFQEFLYTRPSWLKMKEAEDCLYLNIYVPKKSEYPANRRFAVFVFIHGDFGFGDFRSGASNFYPGQTLAAQGDIIVVTLNYRLGHIGFLASITDENAFPGNYGLWDQHVALRWVNRNIAKFGGDPRKVTLAGQQTGALSALYQAMFAGNRGLFHKVIAQSGSPVSESTKEMGPFYSKPNKFQNLGYMMCPFGNDLFLDDTLTCMQEKNITNVLILAGMYKSKTENFKYLPAGPVIDGDFIKADPKDMLDVNNEAYKEERDFFNSLEILIGYNKDDGFQQTLYKLIANWEYPYEDDHMITFDYGVSFSVSTDICDCAYNESLALEKEVKSEYRISDETTIKESQTVINFATDYIFVQPVVNLINYRRQYLDSMPSDHNNGIKEASGSFKTYAYVFNGDSDLEMNIVPKPTWFTGTGNGFELPYVFGFHSDMLKAFQVPGYVASSEQLALSREMMTLWTTFVKSGLTGCSPSGSTVDEWPSVFDLSRYNISTGKWNVPFYLPYLGFTVGQPTTVKYNLAGDHAKLWSSFDKLFGMDFDMPVFGEMTPAATQSTKGSMLGLDVNVAETLVVVFIVLIILLIVGFVSAIIFIWRRGGSMVPVTTDGS